MTISKEEKRKRRKRIISEIFKIEDAASRGLPLDSERLKFLGEQLDKVTAEKTSVEIEKTEKLTKDCYTIAEGNGIDRPALEARFYRYGWPLEKAMTIPVNQKITVEDSGLTPEIYLQAKKELLTDEVIAGRFQISLSALDKYKRANGITRKQLKEKRGQNL